MPPLPPEEAAELLARVREAGIGAGSLASLLGVAETTARHWLSGRRDMPPPVAEVLRMALAFRGSKPTT